LCRLVNQPLDGLARGDALLSRKRSNQVALLAFFRDAEVDLVARGFLS